MRENYLAFVVRPAGDTWELLIESTWCGAAAGQFDVPRGRVPHGRHPDEVLRADQARYGVELGERIATLGQEPLLETRRRSAYVYRAAGELPVSWTREVRPEPGRYKFDLAPVVAHFRFVDLRQAIPIGQDEAGWLDDVRRVLGVAGPAPATLVIWRPADPDSTADPAQVASAIADGRSHPATLAHNFEGLANRIRNHSGWTQDPRRLELSPLGTKANGVGLLVRINRDGGTASQARWATVATAGAEGLWTYDLTARRLFRANEVPAERGSPSTDRELLELRFDRELMAEFARLGAPLMAWPLRPAVDESGRRVDFRLSEEELPHHLWALPENQRVILELEYFSYFFDQDALICPLTQELAPLRAFGDRRVSTAGNVVTTRGFDRVPGWDGLVEHLGWAYLPNGPDALWGDLHVAERNKRLLHPIRHWCLRTGRSWARYERRGDEIVQIAENPKRGQQRARGTAAGRLWR